MKRSMLLIIAVILIAGCSDVSYSFRRYPETPEEVMMYVHNEISYVRDIYSVGKDEYWQSPSETLRWRTGDCEDKAILMMYILKEDLGIDSSLYIIRDPEWPSWHAVVRIDKIFYDPTKNEIFSIYDYDIVRSYSYSLTMLIATRIYTKDIHKMEGIK